MKINIRGGTQARIATSAHDSKERLFKTVSKQKKSPFIKHLHNYVSAEKKKEYALEFGLGVGSYVILKALDYPEWINVTASFFIPMTVNALWKNQKSKKS